MFALGSRCGVSLRAMLYCGLAFGAAVAAVEAQTLAPAPVKAPAAWSPAGDAAATRFVIGLDRVAEFQVFSLTNPNRVIVELPDVRFQLPPPTDGPVGLIKA
ncbi:MAG: AMIN domain-containing protein, partial [Hyphomicrobiaceae bacterium]